MHAPGGAVERAMRESEMAKRIVLAALLCACGATSAKPAAVHVDNEPLDEGGKPLAWMAAPLLPAPSVARNRDSAV